MRHFEISDFPYLAERLGRRSHEEYFAMYSSIYGGIVTDPALMAVPVDDHMVHRGDGVFEAFKSVNGKIYNMRAHLDRLKSSASALELELPVTLEDIGRRVVETVRAGGRQDCLIRLYVSRGPGSFDPDPYDCPESHLYVVITRLPEPFMEKHPTGATVKTSAVPPKTPFFARVKSCNYLNNVLMKKEAVDAGVNFVVGFSSEGLLLEGATANVGIVTAKRALAFPKLEGILRGTTMTRIMVLAGRLIESGELTEAGFADISRDDILDATEMLITGTTLDLIMAREFDGRTIGSGKPGPVYERLRALLTDDMRKNSYVLTPVN